MIITGPGFYTSKAGKCEVVAINNGYAIGWDANGESEKWGCERGISYSVSKHDITGPWVEPRKPVEAWAIQVDGDQFPCLYATEANARMCFHNKTSYHKLPARLIHLREVEDSNDNG